MNVLESNEWEFIIQALHSMQIQGKDALAFVEIIKKLQHQQSLQTKREIKNTEST